MIKATTETINGVATTISVAILTLAAKATGKMPNPALLGPSKLIPKLTKYRTAVNTEQLNPTMDKGNKNSFLFSSLSSL